MQVNSGTHRAPSGSWAVWITRDGRGTSRPYSAEAIDVFGVVDGDRAGYLIPVDVVHRQTCVPLCAYDGYRLAWMVQGAAGAPATRDEGSADPQRTPRTTSG